MTNPTDKTDTLQDKPMTPEQFRQSHTALPTPTPQDKVCPTCDGHGKIWPSKEAYENPWPGNAENRTLPCPTCFTSQVPVDNEELSTKIDLTIAHAEQAAIDDKSMYADMDNNLMNRQTIFNEVTTLLKEATERAEVEGRIDELNRLENSGRRYGWGTTFAIDVKYFADRNGELNRTLTTLDKERTDV